MTIANRLRAERERLGLTQREIAIKTNITEKSQASYESGKTTPNGDYLAIVAEMGMDIQYIVTGRKITEMNRLQEFEDRKMAEALGFLRSEIDHLIEQLKKKDNAYQ
jgi:transcriptional regulator with XRE-family HTH domain